MMSSYYLKPREILYLSQMISRYQFGLRILRKAMNTNDSDDRIRLSFAQLNESSYQTNSINKQDNTIILIYNI